MDAEKNTQAGQNLQSKDPSMEPESSRFSDKSDEGTDALRRSKEWAIEQTLLWMACEHPFIVAPIWAVLLIVAGVLGAALAYRNFSAARRMQMYKRRKGGRKSKSKTVSPISIREAA